MYKLKKKFTRKAKKNKAKRIKQKSFSKKIKISRKRLNKSNKRNKKNKGNKRRRSVKRGGNASEPIPDISSIEGGGDDSEEVTMIPSGGSSCGTHGSDESLGGGMGLNPYLAHRMAKRSRQRGGNATGCGCGI